MNDTRIILPDAHERAKQIARVILDNSFRYNSSLSGGMSGIEDVMLFGSSLDPSKPAGDVDLLNYKSFDKRIKPFVTHF